ncbi:MAG: hypothetical protein Ct9H300mP1_02890 [Planctomycetaceae bacterium]|nr:MAG: hypothetical protein Ct9H300mP1_02890 [Planctomycetaceae bacterium]
MIKLLGSPRQNCDGVTRRETLQAGGLAMLGGKVRISGQPGRRRRQQHPAGSAGQSQERDRAVPAGRGAHAGHVRHETHCPQWSSWRVQPDCLECARDGRLRTSAQARSLDEQVGGGAKRQPQGRLPQPDAQPDRLPRALPSIGVNQDGLPPSMGSVCEYLNDDPSGMPDYVHMPCMLGWGQHIRRAGPYAGFLGRQYDPLFTECNPTSKKPGTDYHPQVTLGTPTLPNARLPKGITLDRLNSRKKLTEQFDDALRQPGVTSEFDRVQDGALSLLTSNRIRNSFDVESEKGEVRTSTAARCLATVP